MSIEGSENPGVGNVWSAKFCNFIGSEWCLVVHDAVVADGADESLFSGLGNVAVLTDVLVSAFVGVFQKALRAENTAFGLGYPF